jgi:branched-chain amino acid transport system ATP-binding protein
VPQGRQLFPRLTVVENLKVIADALRLDRGVVDEALDRFPILRTRPGALAGVLSGASNRCWPWRAG